MQKVRRLHSIFYVGKILGFDFLAFQRNAQPSPQAMISGVWGRKTSGGRLPCADRSGAENVTNKHFRQEYRQRFPA